MSDPVTNSEVEDVLSSIRRLVSEDKRPMQAPKPAPQQDRLVLTPALRVAEEEREEAAAAIDLPAEADEAPRPRPTLESLITDDEPLDVYSDNLITARKSEDADGGEAPEEATLPDDDPSETAARRIEDDYSADPYNFDDDEDRYREDEDRFEPVVPDADDVKEVSNADDPVEGIRLPLRAQVHDQPALKDEAEPSVVLTDERTEANGTPNETSKTIALSAKIAALETAIGKIADTWEPDDPGESDYAGTEADATETMEWVDDDVAAEEDASFDIAQPRDIEAAVTDQENPEDVQSFTAFKPPPGPFVRNSPVPKSEEADAAEATVATTAEATVEQTAEVEPQPTDPALELSEDEQLIDEEALRDLVSDIVRAELQGALGERITRNVRKLVRREIHRALAAQDLE